MSFRSLAAAASLTFAVVTAFASSPGAHAAPVPGAHQVTGTRLATALLPVSVFGPNLSSGPPLTSGNHLLSSRGAVKVSALSCHDFYYQALGDVAHYGYTAMASNGGFAGYRSLTETVYQFASNGRAATYLHALATDSVRCRSFRQAGHQGRTYTIALQSESAMPVSGLQAVRATWSLSSSGVATGYYSYVYVLDGNDLFGLDTTAGRGPRPIPVPVSLLPKLIARVAAL